MWDIRGYFSVPLIDMGSMGQKEMAGIMIPAQDAQREKIGITEQFLDDAAIYHQKYTDTTYFSWLIRTALERACFKPKNPHILDMGSGSGNSVFPCLEIFPDARIVSTDLSPDLLAMMKLHAEGNPSWRDRLGYVCMDACKDYFRHETFDLVIGAAILHHLIDPVQAIQAAKRALRPGGCAIFFEPFENGNAILHLAYTEILKEARNKKLDNSIHRFLAALIEDFRLRNGSDKSAEVFRHIDDKWLFTRSYFEEAAKKSGFSAVEMYPLHDLEKPFTLQTQTNLRLGLGVTPSALPQWAWDILARFDNTFSREL